MKRDQYAGRRSMSGLPPNTVAAGFSLQVGVGTEGGERRKLEHVCRYIARSAVSTERLALTGQGSIRYRLQTVLRAAGLCGMIACVPATPSDYRFARARAPV